MFQLKRSQVYTRQYAHKLNRIYGLKANAFSSVGVTTPEDIINECLRIRSSIQPLNDVSVKKLVTMICFTFHFFSDRNSKDHLKRTPKRILSFPLSSCWEIIHQGSLVSSITFVSVKFKQLGLHRRMTVSRSLCLALLMWIGTVRHSLATQTWALRACAPSGRHWCTTRS